MTDTETFDRIRLQRQFGIRALVLAAFAALGGFLVVAVALGLVGGGLLFASDGR
ncbi:hypothetical protein AB0C38_12860 [Amycolatopsis sp. NPDC048633]|uniref:hypothetical protein n=1 Tax=Amycolatopsis sp. NPDC048633 TaxID=3157095 RepID=UPI0033C2B39F